MHRKTTHGTVCSQERRILKIDTSAWSQKNNISAEKIASGGFAYSDDVYISEVKRSFYIIISCS